MIVYDIGCASGHRFEGWFADAASFDRQRRAGQIPCPVCATTQVDRVLSVPRIGSGSTRSDPRSARSEPRDASANAALAERAATELATIQKAMLAGSRWVGDQFAARARAMADGDEPAATIHGRTTLAEARSLHDDGIAVLPLPFPVVPPETLN